MSDQVLAVLFQESVGRSRQSIAQQIGAGNGGIAGSLDVRLQTHDLGFSRRACALAWSLVPIPDATRLSDSSAPLRHDFARSMASPDRAPFGNRF